MNSQVVSDIIDFLKVLVLGIYEVTSSYFAWIIRSANESNHNIVEFSTGLAWILRILTTALIFGVMFKLVCFVRWIIKKYRERWCTLSLKVLVVSLAIITVFGESIRAVISINLVSLFMLIQIAYLCILWYFDAYFENRYITHIWKDIQNS